ncbi:uncharacterized protein BKCO1_3500053 [Diplodia corticola]|uniref:Uncharacterized protein n=1 Tax=Diplodia corticola TaxID=236234 RepID=A0A1J9RYG9_9PEZI|nr:uncharacterized protein BKCO1_3500053 [Diplodia corticola]OJD32860.1 hypothetical protein BKCO1_3500053 [Diplodia corticola]
MTDDLNPTGPSQPTTAQAYTTPGNPATHNPAERAAAADSSPSSSSSGPAVVDRRVPTKQTTADDEATASSLGRGVRKPGAAGEEAKGLRDEDVGRHRELDAQQMAAPGEGRVAAAVRGGEDGMKTGSGGVEPGLETDLERKKAEQAPLRDAIKEERQHNVDVGGVLGQTGGPANPVDKDNYPNSSS